MVDWNQWRRTHSTLEMKFGTTVLARVHRVRPGRWRARILPMYFPASSGRDNSSFPSMQKACAWAQGQSERALGELMLRELPRML